MGPKYVGSLSIKYAPVSSYSINERTEKETSATYKHPNCTAMPWKPSPAKTL